MKKFRFFILALLCLICAVFSGCNGEVSDVNANEFGITFTLPGKKTRTVFYDVSEITKYDIFVFMNGYEVISRTAEPGESVKIKLDDLGDYIISVIGKDNSGNPLANGTGTVSFAEGDGYKDVIIYMEPEEKTVGINAKAVWESEKEGYFNSSDAVRYDVTIYLYDEEIAFYENVGIFNKNYTINIPWYNTYKIKIEAKKATDKIVGIGEADFSLVKGDTFKNVEITIIALPKNVQPAEFGINAIFDFIEDGYQGEKIQFGQWPQTLTDVNGLTLEPTGKFYDGHTEYAANDGNKYVKVDDSYYKVQPMVWRVIEYKSDGSKKLLADKAYTNIAFYETTSGYRELGEQKIYPNNYTYSNIRAYLNSINNQFVTDGGTATDNDKDWSASGFFNCAFSEEEKAKIKDTLVDNGLHTTEFRDVKYICKNTIDKIFLLSYQDTYRKQYGFEYSKDKKVTPTDYAKSKGTWEVSSGRWWTRTPGSEDYYADLVKGGGCDYYEVNLNFGVVPALIIAE